MKIPRLQLIDRYILGQFFVTFFFAVLVLSTVLVLANIFRRLLEVLVQTDVEFSYVLNFMAFVLPFSLTFTIPWGLLTAVLLVFGRLSADNELVALRSLGVSVARLCIPIFAFTALMCAICLWINIQIAPEAQARMKRTLSQIAKDNPLALFGEDQIITAFPDKRIYIGDRDGRTLNNVQVIQQGDGNNTAMEIIVAQEGKLIVDEETNNIELELEDANVFKRDPEDPNDERKITRGSSETWYFPVPMEKFYQENETRLGLSDMTINELSVELKERKADEKAGEIDEDFEGAMPVLFEIQKRYSFSVAGFALALLGVPLAITAHRKETSIGFLISMGIAFSYFVLLIFVETFKNDVSALPHLLIWLPNFLFIGLGLYLFWRMNRR